MESSRWGSWTRLRRAWRGWRGVGTVALVLGLGFVPFVVRALAPIQATVRVVAVDPNGYALSYHWRTSDGTIIDANAPTTTWTLPNGPGVHFAYVLVTNGHGGYTQQRVPVITDGIGNPLTAPAPLSIDAPALAAPSGDVYRGRLHSVSRLDDGSLAVLPDVPVALRDPASGRMYPPQTCATLPCTVKTDLRGEFVIHDIPPTTDLQILCAFDRGTVLRDCGSLTKNPGLAEFQLGVGPNPIQFGGPDIVGAALGADGRPCGTITRFFAVAANGTTLGEVSATATLLDGSGAILQGPVRLDAFGNYEFLANTRAASIRLNCEAATAITVPVPASTASGGGFVARSVFANVAHPVVDPGRNAATLMSATLSNGKVFNGPLLPPGSGSLPSDQRPVLNRFFSFLGLDTRLGACQYYRSIGGVQGCDAQGNFVGAITFDDWKRSEKMTPYVSGNAIEHTASYVNRVDLNLTRKHHLVSYGTNQTAGYVCNHLGPTVSRVGLDALQADVDTAVSNALAGNNLVACVAMDYRVHVGANGGKPFTRFFIFGPDGSLLPSINLDFEAEKYVPGVCVACHGGDHYVGPFPEDTSGQPDVGAHFLPFDPANFSYSSASSLTEVAQDAELAAMNQLVAGNTGATAAAKELIAGWYASGGVHADSAWVPDGWRDTTANIAFYQNVYARHCRTCHVNMPDAFPTAANVLHFAQTMCGGYKGAWRNHTMPNSMVTFNRFWLGGGTGNGPDQIMPTEQWPVDGSRTVNYANCYLSTAP